MGAFLEVPMDRMKRLRQEGQAIWLDYIRRDLLVGGGLGRLVETDGVTGVTSNPAIFQQAIGESAEYDDAIEKALTERPEASATELYEVLAVEDIRMAADILRGVYDATDAADGFVSLEVSPHLARDREGTVSEAVRLWQRVDRPNLMIKVPATEEGLPAIEELVSRGINVNVTLMFSLAHYEKVSRAYLRGLDRCADPTRVASVASFFVSRVDSLVDVRLEEIGTEEALAYRGKVAVANAKLAYRRFREIFDGEDFAALRDRGARVQRPLWASTSTKNPSYRDVIYVEELIGPETVNTMPPATVEAFRDHGEPRPSLVEDVGVAEAVLGRLEALGIDLDQVTEELQREGVEKFALPFDRLLATLDEKSRSLTAGLAGKEQG